MKSCSRLILCDIATQRSYDVLEMRSVDSGVSTSGSTSRRIHRRQPSLGRAGLYSDARMPPRRLGGRRTCVLTGTLLATVSRDALWRLLSIATESKRLESGRAWPIGRLRPPTAVADHVSQAEALLHGSGSSGRDAIGMPACERLYRVPRSMPGEAFCIRTSYTVSGPMEPKCLQAKESSPAPSSTY
jgi:hypothetical protein